MVSDVLNRLTVRPRPLTSLPEVRPLVDGPGSYAFPWGHAASALSTATGVVLVAKRSIERIAASIHHRSPCRKSGPQITPETVEALDTIERELWRRERRGMGELSSRDVYAALIKLAREVGTVIPAGVRVSVGVRPLAIAAGVGSVNTVRKAIDRLRLAGMVRRDDAGRRGNDAGALVLLHPPRKSDSGFSAPRMASILTGCPNAPDKSCGLSPLFARSRDDGRGVFWHGW
jgi:hypothetical protein